MNISTVDLRRRTAEVIAALRRGESIRLSYRGRDTAVIEPIDHAKASMATRVQDHPLFGSRTSEKSVEAIINRLRAPRYEVGPEDAV